MSQARQAGLREATRVEEGYAEITSDFDLRAHLSTGTVLELGPGQLEFAELARSAGSRVILVDNDPAVIRLAAYRGFIGHEQDLRSLPESGGSGAFQPGRYGGLFARWSTNPLWFARSPERHHAWVSALAALLGEDGWAWIAPFCYSTVAIDPEELRGAVREQLRAFADLGFEVLMLSREIAFRYGMRAGWLQCQPLITRNLHHPSLDQRQDVVVAHPRARSRLQPDPSRGRPALELPDPAALLRYLRHALNALTTRKDAHVAHPARHGRMYAKYWSSLGRAAVYAYEATGDDAFLHLFVEAYEPLLEARIELGYPRRPAWAVEDNDQPDPSVAGRMALPACELLLLLRREPGFELSLGTRHDRYLASIIDCVAPFEPDWRPADPIGGSFAARAGGALLPFAATGPLGAALAYLHELTGERLYGERVAAMTSLFFSCCQADTERTYTWPTRPGASSLAAGGTAAQALELPVAAWRQRLGATPERMQALSHTFLERWLPSPEELSAAAAGGDRGPKLSLLRRIGAVSTGVLLSDSCPNVAEAFAARAALLEPLASPLWLRSGRPMVLALALLLRGRSTRGVI